MWCRTVGCILTLTLSLLAALLAAHAQPAGKVPRIGVIMPGIPPGEAGDELDVFRQGLRDLGYIEGQTIALEVRWGEGQHGGTPPWPPTWPGCPWTSLSRRVAHRPERPSKRPQRFPS